MPPASTSTIAAGFMVGSALFAVGSVPTLTEDLGANAAWLFFTGSLFFTAAALGQLVQASAGPTVPIRGRALGWWAAAVQCVGTLWFNVSTFDALLDLGVTGERVLVWAPDAVGSACFLVASLLALAALAPDWWAPRRRVWRVAVVNLAGSVAFGVAALAARVLDDGSLADARRVNTATFVGAVCFFVGALWLRAEGDRAAA